MAKAKVKSSRKPTARKAVVRRKSTSQSDVLAGTLGKRTVPNLWHPHDMKRIHAIDLLRRFGRWVHRCITINSQTAASIRPRLFVMGNKEQVQKMHWLKPKAIDRRTKAFLQGDARLKPGAVARKRLAGNIDDLTEVMEHPALDVLDNVNDWEEGFGFREALYADLDMFGRAFINLIGPKGGPPEGMWRMLPHLTRPIPHATDFVAGFEYGRGTEKHTFAPEDVWWLKLHDPEDPWGGFGPLEAWLQTFDADFTMVAFQQWLFNRGGTPDVLITVKGGLSEGQRKTMRTDWRRMFGNMGNREESLAILEGEGTAVQLSQKPREMEFLESRNLIRDEAGNAFGVPKSKLTSDDVNLANAEVGDRQHITNKVWPMVTRVEDASNQRLLPRWSDRLVLVHENPLGEDQAIVIANRESKLRSGWSVERVMLDEGEEPPDDPMAKKPLIATGLVPLENITEAGKPPPAPEGGIGGFGAGDKAMAEPAPADAVLKRLDELGQRIEAIAKALPEPKQECTHTHASQSADLAKAWDEQPDVVGDFHGVPIIRVKRHPPDFIWACEDIHNREFYNAWNKPTFAIKDAPPEELDAGSVPGFVRRMEAALRNQVNAIIAGLERGTNDALMAGLKPEVIEGISLAARPFIERAIKIGGEFGMDRLKQKMGKAQKAEQPNIVPAFDVTNPYVQEFVDNYTVRLTQQISNTTLVRAKDLLDGALSRGESVQQMAARVEEWAGEALPNRAENIARTESARAYVEGEQQAWKQSGVVQAKSWLLAPGACEICEAIAAEFNSKSVPLDQPFYRMGAQIGLKGGGTFTVDYSDINGPPAHPQCRCDVIAVLNGGA